MKYIKFSILYSIGYVILLLIMVFNTFVKRLQALGGLTEYLNLEQKIKSAILMGNFDGFPTKIYLIIIITLVIGIALMYYAIRINKNRILVIVLVVYIGVITAFFALSFVLSLLFIPIFVLTIIGIIANQDHFNIRISRDNSDNKE